MMYTDELLYRMGSIGKDSTGCDFTIWVLECIDEGTPIVKICKDNALSPNNIIADISIEPVPKIIKGKCTDEQLIQISKWINLNMNSLLIFWTCEEYDFWDNIKSIL